MKPGRAKKPEGASRAERVGERVRAEIADLVLRGRLRDPLTRDVVISGVKMTPDLQTAYVYVRVLQEVDERRKARVVEGLNRAAGFVRKEIAPKLGLRRVPELRFFWDEVVDTAQRLDALFAEIDEEQTQEQTGDPSDGDPDEEPES